MANQRIPMFQADAFTDELFRGNPAAVCFLETELPDDQMLSIAIENQLSETAFLRKTAEGWSLRWFTPGGEVNLCGHATLASGHIVLTELHPTESDVTFHSVSGPLRVVKEETGYLLDLPSWPGEPVDVHPAWGAALGATPLAARQTQRDIYVRLESEAAVHNLTPDFRALAQLIDQGIDGVGVAARGSEHDVVSRFFAPALDIDEDPVTGSAHSTWVPWFAEELGKTELRCWQASRRGGHLVATLRDDRVELRGGAVTYLRGEIEVPRV